MDGISGTRKQAGNDVTDVLGNRETATGEKTAERHITRADRQMSDDRKDEQHS